MPGAIHSIELFGCPRIRTVDGEVSTFRGKPGAVLTLLALAPNRGVARAELLEKVWPGEPASATRARLRTALTTLRAAIAEGRAVIPPREHTVSLILGDYVTVDVHAFDKLLARAEDVSDPDQQIRCYASALELYRGRLGDGTDCDEVQSYCSRYEQKARAAREALDGLLRARDAIRETAKGDSNRPNGSTSAQVPSTGGTESGSAPEQTADGLFIHSPGATWRSFLTAAALVILIVLFVVLSPGDKSPFAVSSHGLPPHTASPLRSRDRFAQLEWLASPAPIATPGNNTLEQQRADVVVEISEEASRHWYQADEQAWVLALQPHHPAIQHSLEWLLAHDATRAVQVAGALSRFWWLLGLKDDARDCLDRALRLARADDSLSRARALCFRGMCTMDDRETTEERARRANERALADVQASVAMYRRLRDPWGIANATRCEGHVFHALRREADAMLRFQEAYSLFREQGNDSGQACALWGMAIITLPHQTPYEHAARTTRNALDSLLLSRKSGNTSILNDARDALVQQSGSLLTAVGPRPEPRVSDLLLRCRDALESELQDPALLQRRPETVSVRKQLLKIAERMDDGRVMVEQIGQLFSEQGDRWVGEEHLQGEIAAAYLQHLRLTERPVFAAHYARRLVERARKIAPLRPLTLSTAALAAANRPTQSLP